MLHLGGVGDEAHLRGTLLYPEMPAKAPTGEMDDLILMLALAKATELQGLLTQKVRRKPLLPSLPSDMLSRLARRR